MIPFILSGDSYARLTGNPTLTSLDGTIRATLQTILAPGWPEGYAEYFGIYLVDVTPPVESSFVGYYPFDTHPGYSSYFLDYEFVENETYTLFIVAQPA